jgi:steroid delta-isomerase-like uncharacterized protein
MVDNAAIARRWFREVWISGGEATVDELMAPDGVGWMEGRTVRGVADFKDARRQLLDVFPDLKITVEDLVHEDDKVVVRWSVQATHGGGGLGIPTTNRQVSFRGMTWLEMRDGLIVRGWDSWNLGGLIQTLMQPESVASSTAQV